MYLEIYYNYNIEKWLVLKGKKVGVARKKYIPVK